jgi:hypothetical protein
MTPLLAIQEQENLKPAHIAAIIGAAAEDLMFGKRGPRNEADM